MNDFYKNILLLDTETNDLPILERRKGYSGDVEFVTDGNIQTHCFYGCIIPSNRIFLTWDSFCRYFPNIQSDIFAMRMSLSMEKHSGQCALLLDPNGLATALPRKHGVALTRRQLNVRGWSHPADSLLGERRLLLTFILCCLLLSQEEHIIILWGL